MARRLAAMKAKFKLEGDRRLYMTKPGAEGMDVTCAPVTACRACNNAGSGVKHHWFRECPGFDLGGRCPVGRPAIESRQAVVVVQPTDFHDGNDVVRSGVGYGQLGDGCGRRMGHLRGCPASILLSKEHHGYILYVPTTANWHFWSDMRRSIAWRHKPAGICSNCGAWGILGASSGGRCQQCAHWKKWDGCQNWLPEGYGGPQSGPHLIRPPAPTQVCIVFVLT